MPENQDAAGWYPDPTGTHELRYWDGYVWKDDVSDQGTPAKDPLGGKPFGTPSEEEAKRSQPAAPPPEKRSRLPLVIAGVVALLVIVVAVVVIVGRSGGGGGTATLEKASTFSDDAKDAAHPTVHTFTVDANSVVVIKVTTTEKDLTPAVIVETNAGVASSIQKQISDLNSDFASSQLKEACANLREEDIGAKGNSLYPVDFEIEDDNTLKGFAIMPVKGDFDFIPVLVNNKDQCVAGKLTMTLTPRKLDLSSASNVSDLDSILSDNSDLSSILDSENSEFATDFSS